MGNRIVYGSFRGVEPLENRQMLAFGATDPDFGVDGVVTRDVDASNVTARDMLVLPSGGILTATDYGMARFDAEGSRVNTFGRNGLLTFPGFSFRGMATDGQSYVYVLGTAASGTVVSRYTLGGKPAGGYGGNSTSYTALVIAPGAFVPSAIAVDGAGRVLLGGVDSAVDGAAKAAKIVRLTASGSVDSNGFGGAGATVIQLANSSVLYPRLHDKVVGIHVLNNGKILVAGGGTGIAPGFFDPQTRRYIDAAIGDTVFAVAKLNANGSIDTAYGEDGVARNVYIQAGTGDRNEFNYTDFQPEASTLLSDGSVVLGGHGDGGAFARFDSLGDLAFELQADTSLVNSPADLATLADGRVAVLATGRGTAMLSISTLKSDGTLGTPVLVPNTISGSYGNAQIAATSDGDFVVFGTPDSGGYGVGKFDAGAANDARPDEFANARANDIVQDNQGRLHIAYYDAATTTLKYAMRDERGVWSATRVIDARPNAGQYVSIDTDSRGNPAIAYFDGTDGDLELATFAGNTWTLRTVESRGSVGLYPSLDIDDSDRPTMTYYKKTGGDLRFARFDPTTVSFSFETVDADGDTGRSSTLVASPKTRRYSIAYANTTTGEVKWAGRKKGGVGWTIKTAAETAGGADFISMAYGNYYEPAISFYDAATADLKVSYFDANSQVFVPRTIATSGATGLYSQITFSNDYYGQPVVFAWNRSSDRIVRYSSPLNGTVQAVTTSSDAGRYLSLDATPGRAVAAYFDADANRIKVRDVSLS